MRLIAGRRRSRLAWLGLGLVALALVIILPWRIVARRVPAPSAATSRVAAVTGRVVTPDGKPIARARVSLIEYRDDEGTEGASTTTDAAGAFRFPRAEWRHHQAPPVVVAQAPGWAMVHHQAPYSGKPLLLTLAPAAPLQVAFRDAEGRPIRGLPVTVRFVVLPGGSGQLLLPQAWRDRWTQKTDARGLVTFPSLPPRAQGRLMATDERFAQLGDDGWFDLEKLSSRMLGPITVIPGGTISGTVRYGPTGRPAAGIKVGAAEIGEGAGGGQALTDRRGRYRITQLVPANYNVALDLWRHGDRDWAAAAREAVPVEEGETVEDIDLTLVKGAVLTGRVTGTDTHKGVPGVLIGIYGPAHPATTGWVQRAETDEHGRYWTRVPAGRQHVYVQPPRGYIDPKTTDPYLQVVDRDVLTKDGRTYTIDFRFAGPVRPIHGRVVDARHRPVPGADVVVVRFESKTETERRLRTDARGEFALPAGAVFLRAVHASAATVKATKVTLGGEVTLVLEEGALGAAAGTIVDPASRPLPGVRVELRAVPEHGHANPQAPPAATAITGGDGRYVFPALWPNRQYEVTVQVSALGHLAQQFTLKPGQRLELPPTTMPAAPPAPPPAP